MCGTKPSAALTSLAVARTVASVGPYALTNVEEPSQHADNLRRSPPVKTYRSDSRLGRKGWRSGMRNAGRKVCVMRFRASQFAVSMERSCDNFGPMKIVLFDARYGHISQTLASKPTLAKSAALAFELSANLLWCQAMRFARFPCSTTTPLGRPVLPEVQMMYAALALVTSALGGWNGMASIQSASASRSMSRARPT